MFCEGPLNELWVRAEVIIGDQQLHSAISSLITHKWHTQQAHREITIP